MGAIQPNKTVTVPIPPDDDDGCIKSVRVREVLNDPSPLAIDRCNLDV